MNIPFNQSDLLAYLEVARYALQDDDILHEAGERMDLSEREMDRLHQQLIDFMEKE